MLHMSQINYNILQELMKHDIHIRGLAKSLNTNQTTTARKMREFEGLNIVDFRIEGKNKVYSVKDSIEAEEHIKIMEHAKLITAMQKYPVIKQIAEDINSNPKIRLAILFGSYAKNKAEKNSDIDLYVETDDRKLTKEVELINSRLSVKFGRFDTETLLAKEIIANHVIIKGVERYYELVHKKIGKGEKDKSK